MKLTRRQLLSTVPVAAPLVLAGCGSILSTQPYVARTDWPLAPPPSGQGAASASRAVVLVHGIQAGPALSQSGLITLLPNGSFHRGYYNRWATPPAEATTAALLAWLQASGDFAAVVGEGSALSPTLIVEGTLNALLADPARNIARASLTLVVAKPVGIGERPLAQRMLTASAPLAGKTAPDLVTAQRAALATVLGQAVAMVSRYGRGRSARS